MRARTKYLDRPKDVISFKIVSPNGGQVSIDSVRRNGKMTVLLCWSLNCQSCMEHILDYASIIEAGQKTQTFNVIMLSCDTHEDWAKAYPGGLDAFVKKAGIKVPVYCLKAEDFSYLGSTFDNFRFPECHVLYENGQVAKRFVLNEPGIAEAWDLVTQNALVDISKKSPTKKEDIMSAPIESKIVNLDMPQKPVSLGLVELKRGMNAFATGNRFRTSRIGNGKPTALLTWLSVHEPCVANLTQYTMLDTLASETQAVNFFILDYHPDLRQSEDLRILFNNTKHLSLEFPLHALDPTFDENLHPSKQFQTFSVPEFILIDNNNKVYEHFVLIDPPSFKKATSLVLRP